MNTEQLKTPQQHIVDLTRKSYGEDFKGMNDSDTLLQITRGNSGLFIRAMQDFANQESNKAVSEFKDKLLARFIELKSKATTLRDTIYLDGVLAVISSMT